MRDVVRLRRHCLVVLVFLAFAQIGATSLTFGGVVTQSTQDRTGPALNDAAVNQILDGDVYAVAIQLTGPIATPSRMTTGSGCFAGNQLDANFQIPAEMLKRLPPSSGADVARGLPEPLAAGGVGLSRRWRGQRWKTDFGRR